MVPPLALVCSVELEAAPLRGRLQVPEPLVVGGRAACAGTLGEAAVVLLVGGMGKTNAAQALTALLETRAVRGVIGFGVGGAYPGARLATADVVLASSESYGDEGVETPEGWVSTQAMDIPLLEHGGARWFNRFDLDARRIELARAALHETGVEATTGAFLTVSACSGTAHRGEALAKRFGAICETMEGAAYAHVCAHYGQPFVEVRSISNLVEDRDLSRWRLREAAEAAASAAAVVARSWKD